MDRSETVPEINARLATQREDLSIDALCDWLRREAGESMDSSYHGSYQPTTHQLESWEEGVRGLQKIARAALISTLDIKPDLPLPEKE